MVTATRRERGTLAIEEASMNVTVIAGELRDKHDPRESLVLAALLTDLHDLRPYLAAEGPGRQLLEHAILGATIAMQIDEQENESHTYIVGQSRVIAAQTQQNARDEG